MCLYELMFGVVEDAYPSSEAKLSLACAVAQAAKRHLVSEYGIGEELPVNLFGWNGDKLGVVAQIDSGWGDMDDHEDRIERTSMAANALRTGWKVDAFTMVAEAFVSTKPRDTKNDTLSSQYAEGSGDIRECLTAVHVGIDEHEVVEIQVIAQPFDIEVGKKVVFGDILHAPNPGMFRESGYVECLEESLMELQPTQIEDEEAIRAMRVELMMMVADEAGWFIQNDL